MVAGAPRGVVRLLPTNAAARHLTRRRAEAATGTKCAGPTGQYVRRDNPTNGFSGVMTAASRCFATSAQASSRACTATRPLGADTDRSCEAWVSPEPDVPPNVLSDQLDLPEPHSRGERCHEALDTGIVRQLVERSVGCTHRREHLLMAAP